MPPRPEAPESLLEDGPIRLVAAGLHGSDDGIERDFELPGCGGGQAVVNVRYDGKPATAAKGAQRLHRIGKGPSRWDRGLPQRPSSFGD
jgi:hypothetical protein